MSRVSRKEDQFYEMIQALAKDIVLAGEVFYSIVTEWPNVDSQLKKVDELENQGDKDCKQILSELNVSFITPFDREDLSALVRKMDDIVDAIEGTTARFTLFDVHEMIPEAHEMANLVLDATKELGVLFEHLPNFKKDSVVMDQTHVVHKIEGTGDKVYRNALGRIFSERGDSIHIIKWKSLLDSMEEILDASKDAVNIIQSVVMKNA